MIEVRDVAAKVTATAINEVLRELGINQIVSGVAVFPLGREAYFVDVVMHGLTTNGTWSVSFTIPRQDQERSPVVKD